MLTSLAFLAVLAPQNPGDVVINEFSYDDGGTDDMEFVELYNATAGAIDISGWIVGGEDALGPNYAYTVAAGTILLPGRYFVMGSPGAGNVDQQITNPNDGTFTNLFENEEEGLFVKDVNGQTIDRVDYETYGGTWAPAGREGGGIPGGQNASGGRMSYQRYRDGLDTDDNGDDFKLGSWTLGATNDLANNLPYVGIFDADALGQPLAAWPGSFVDGIVIDPTQPTNGNPSVIPASPQGGNAAIFYDPAGGGNACPLVSAPVQDVIFECYAYFETGQTSGSNDAETWSVGVRGNVDAYGQHARIDPRLTQITGVNWKPGLTGLCWVYQRTRQYTTLWLVDYNDGGDDFTVLHTEQIVAGQNDGWQRLRIRAVGDRVEADFGGTYGRTDGVHVSARTTLRAGGVYIGYREGLLTNPEWRPVTLDLISVAPGSGSIVEHGQGAPTSQGNIPDADVNSFPFIGNASFAYTCANLLPSQGASLVVGFSLLGTPLDLSLVGGQRGSFFYVNGIASASVPTDANGDASVSLPIPAASALIGAPLWGQWFQGDPALGIGLPLNDSEAVGIVIGI